MDTINETPANIDENQKLEETIQKTVDEIITNLLVENPSITNTKSIEEKSIEEEVDKYAQIFDKEFLDEVLTRIKKNMLQKYQVQISGEKSQEKHEHEIFEANLHTDSNNFRKFRWIKSMAKSHGLDYILENEGGFLLDLSENISQNTDSSKAFKFLMDEIDSK